MSIAKKMEEGYTDGTMDFDRLVPDKTLETLTVPGDAIQIPAELLSFIAGKAFERLSFTFTRNHLEHILSIFQNGKTSYNDRLVASMLLENAIISAKGVYPLCQDTGIAQVFAWKDNTVQTTGDDTESLTAGIARTYTSRNLRFSTTVPTSLFTEYDPHNNLPAQILINAVKASSSSTSAYRFLFCAKGGGSSNKTAFFQETKALLNEKSFTEFIKKQILNLGTAACPPYTIAVIVGGLSPEQNLLTLKLATTGYFDTELSFWDYSVFGTKPLRDREWEKKILDFACETGLGAQFGGKSFAVKACVLRLPRHGASCPVSIGVSCSAHRNLHGYIDSSGVYLEQTVENPMSIPGLDEAIAFSRNSNKKNLSIQKLSIDLDLGIEATRASLSKLECGTPVILSGKILVARDAAHALWHNLITEGKALPGYVGKYAIFYAGPAEKPKNHICGSIGPTSALRMDEYCDDLMSRGAALVTVAKGNRGEKWRKACRTYGATYLGTVGGAAALIAEKHITGSEIIDYADLGMEAVHLVTVKNLPVFVLINDQGQDFYQTIPETNKCR